MDSEPRPTVRAHAAPKWRFHKPRLNFDQRIFFRALLVWIPTFIVVIILLWRADYSDQTRWTVVLLLAFFALIAAGSLQTIVLRPLQTLSNMLSAIREEDFSFKGRGASHADSLSELVLEINALSEALRDRRYGAMEAIALMKKVMMEIDVAVFTFDTGGTLRMVNRAGEQLLAKTADHLIGHSAEQLGLRSYLGEKEVRNVTASFGGREGRWMIQTRGFRESGVPHTLLLISDLSRALRDEEREAWQRLTRVLGHELNNSLAPIKSIASTLRSLTSRSELPHDWQNDAQRGLDVIITRADALARFMQGYTRLARLPAPNIREVDVRELVTHAAATDARLPVRVVPGPEITIPGDPDQLEQVLINLVKNAVDATLPSNGRVEIGWIRENGNVVIRLSDEGEGLINKSNLFVPFFTTKPGGSGIGLALSRQIAEAHGGTLTLENRNDRLGCVATLQLPAN
jgi:two-component system, NtrC family, nitrogen regulation sensor histidine kinase NtrY